MSLWDTVKSLVTTEQHQLINEEIPVARVEKGTPAVAGLAERHYFRVKVAQMFLKDKAKLWTNMYPAAHSMIRCSFAGKNIELPNVADSTRLFAKPTGSGDLVVKNFTLVPLMPFKGGTVDLIAGLFAVAGDNKVKEFVGVMSEFAGLLSVPQLSSVLNIAGPLATGVQALIGGTGLHLGYRDSFVDSAGAGKPLASGYIAVIRSTEAKLRQRLLVIGDELYEGASLTDAGKAPFERADFLLLHIELRETRDDWKDLSNIATPFAAAIDALTASDQPRADSQVRLAIAAALKADELTQADRRRVIDLIKQEYQDARDSLETKGLVETDAGDLQAKMNNFARAVSAEKALSQTPPSWADVENVSTR